MAELDLLKKDFASNKYPEKVMRVLIEKKTQHRKQKCSDNKLVCMASIPYIIGLSEKFKRISTDQ